MGTMVPWKKVLLGEVAQVQTGISVSANRDLSGTTEELPYLRVANVKEGRLDLAEVKTIRVPKESVERYLLRDGDVLLTEGGDFDKLGRGCVWRNEISRCVHQNHVFAVRPDEQQLLPDFLAFLCRSRHGKNYFLGCAKQTTNLASINSTQLKSFPIPVPPIEVQAEICSILNRYVKTIELQGCLIEAKQRFWRNLLKQLLSGGRRFPEFGKAIRGRVLPSGWKYSTLSDLISINTRIVPENTDPSYEFHYLEISDVDGGLVYLPEERISFKNAPSRARRLVRKGDILLSTVRPSLEGFGRYEGDKDNVVASTGFAVLSDKGLSDMSFVYHLLYSHGVQRQLAGMVLGSGYPAVSASDIRLLRVPTPHLQEQARIGKALDCLQKEILLCSAVRDKLRAEQRTLLDGLMTQAI